MSQTGEFRRRSGCRACTIWARPRAGIQWAAARPLVHSVCGHRRRPRGGLATRESQGRGENAWVPAFTRRLGETGREYEKTQFLTTNNLQAWIALAISLMHPGEWIIRPT